MVFVCLSVSVFLVSFTSLSIGGDEPRYYYVFESNGKMGFMDQNGKVLIPARYYSLGNFSEGLASAKLGEKWGFIDTNGKTVVKPQFDGVASFVDGVAMCS